MTHRKKLLQLLQEKGFDPLDDPSEPDRIPLRKTPDPDHPERKPAKPGLPVWLHLAAPEAEAPADIRQGVTLAHDDMRRTLYYLGKAVGTEDALAFFKMSKHNVQRALYQAGLIAREPPADWQDVEMDDAFPSGW